MASTAALPFLLLLLPLLLGAARGNEGGAAGSCPCVRVKKPPAFPERLVSCDSCGSVTRFHFPKRRVCDLHEVPWVIEFKNAHCQKGHPGEGAGQADASRGDRLPAPTSPRTGPAPTSSSSASVSPDESSRETGWAAESHTDAPRVPATAGSGPEASAEAAAREAGEAPLEEGEAAPPPVPDAKTPSIIAVVGCVALAAGAAAAAALACCWRRRQRRRGRAGQGPQAPLGGEEEGALCLPGENT